MAGLHGITVLSMEEFITHCNAFLFLIIAFFSFPYQDSKQQILTSSVWIRMAWVDDRLAWDLEDYNMTKIIVPNAVLWRPDLVLYGK